MKQSKKSLEILFKETVSDRGTTEQKSPMYIVNQRKYEMYALVKATGGRLPCVYMASQFGSRLTENQYAEYSYGSLVVSPDMPMELLDMCLLNAILQSAYTAELSARLPSVPVTVDLDTRDTIHKMWINLRVDKAIAHLHKVGLLPGVTFNQTYFNIKTEFLATRLHRLCPGLKKSDRRLQEQHFISRVVKDTS